MLVVEDNILNWCEFKKKRGVCITGSCGSSVPHWWTVQVPTSQQKEGVYDVPKRHPVSDTWVCVCVCLSHCLPPLSHKPLRTVPLTNTFRKTVSEANQENLTAFDVPNAWEFAMNLCTFASFTLVPERFGETQCSVQCAMLLLCS